MQRQRKVMKKLQEKPVFYLKADKGNAVVIAEKTDYDAAMFEKLRTERYSELKKDPWPDSIKRVKKALKECRLIIEDPAKLRTAKNKWSSKNT